MEVCTLNAENIIEAVTRAEQAMNQLTCSCCYFFLLGALELCLVVSKLVTGIWLALWIVMLLALQIAICLRALHFYRKWRRFYEDPHAKVGYGIVHELKRRA